MSFYPPRVNERFRSGKRVGTIEDSSASATAASFVCGSFTTLSLSISSQGTIDEARFRTNGCGFMVATADVVAEWLRGKELTDLHGLSDEELSQLVREELGDFPDNRLQCADIVFEALRKGMAAYRERLVQEFRGDVALICTCFGVSEDTIAAVIATNDVEDVEDVSALCRAGSGCGSCRMLIQEMIDGVIDS